MALGVLAALAVAIILLLVAGTGSNPAPTAHDAPVVRTQVSGFVAGLQSHDAARICDALSPAARRSASAVKPCADYELRLIALSGAPARWPTQAQIKSAAVSVSGASATLSVPLKPSQIRLNTTMNRLRFNLTRVAGRWYVAGPPMLATVLPARS